jgi:hypothetical protein
MWNQVSDALSESTRGVVMSAARFLPGLLAMVAALLLALLVAWVVRVGLRRSLRGADFDRHVSRWGFSDVGSWSPSGSPSALIVSAVSWMIVLIGFLVGLAAFNAELPTRMSIRVLAYLPNVFVAFLLLGVGRLLAGYLSRGVLIGAVNLRLESATLLSLGVKWLILVLAGAMALEHLGIGGNIVDLAFAILFGGIVLALALAVGLGSKDMVRRSWDRQSSRTEDEIKDDFPTV